MIKSHYSVMFSVFIFLLFLFGAWQAYSFSELAKFFPYYIAIVGAVLALIIVIVSIVSIQKEKEGVKQVDSVDSSEQDSDEDGKLTLRYMAWFTGYIVLIYVIGFLAATTLFLILFLYLETKYSVLKILISVIATHTVIYLFSSAINLYWPEGIFPIWPF